MQRLLPPTTYPYHLPPTTCPICQLNPLYTINIIRLNCPQIQILRITIMIIREMVLVITQFTRETFRQIDDNENPPHTVERYST